MTTLRRRIDRFFLAMSQLQQKLLKTRIYCIILQ